MENGGRVNRERWMENRKEATDVGDAGVARPVGDDRQWQMPATSPSPLTADSHSVTHTHARTNTRV